MRDYTFYYKDGKNAFYCMCCDEHHAIEEYERRQDAYLNPESPYYGAKLVEMINAPSGITFSVSFYWREKLKWLPDSFGRKKCNSCNGSFSLFKRKSSSG